MLIQNTFTKYTLSSEYILRQGTNNKYFLYHSVSSIRHEISKKLYLLLKLYRNNLLSINDLCGYLTQQGIDVSSGDIMRHLNNINIPNLLQQSNYPYAEDNMYDNISIHSSNYEYTPERVDWLITEKCNLSCLHCFQNSSPNKVVSSFDISFLQRIFNEMDILNVENLKITGGEPLLVDQGKSIFKLMIDNKFGKTILTNCMLIDDEWVDIFSNNKFHLSTSLDGATNTTHDFLRGRGSFERLISNLLKLRDKNIYVAITVTIHRRNQHELMNIAEYAFDVLNARKVLFNFLRPIGRAKNNISLLLTNQDLLSVKELLLEIKNKYKDKISINNESDLLMIPEAISYTPTTKISCAAGTSLVAFDNNYDVYPCTYGIGHQEFKMGNLQHQSLAEIWHSKTWGYFRGGISLEQIKGCSTCQYISRCTLKQCRLKPYNESGELLTHVTYCYAEQNKLIANTI